MMCMILKYSNLIVPYYTTEKKYYRYLRLLSILLHRVINYHDLLMYRYTLGRFRASAIFMIADAPPENVCGDVSNMSLRSPQNVTNCEDAVESWFNQ